MNADELPSWQVAEAKTRFCALLDRVALEGAQRVTRYGQTAAILVRPQDWSAPPAARFAELVAAARAVVLTDEEVDTLFRRDLTPGAPAELEPQAEPGPVGEGEAETRLEDGR